jgi:uncharacterized phage protein gp47/JayE
MAFNRPTLQELIERIDQDLLSRLPQAQASLGTRLTESLATSQAGAVNGLYGYLQWLERQLFPETCDDDVLHLHSAGVPRREAAKATGTVEFTGDDGASIPTGTLLQKDEQEYETTESATISGGTATASVEATEPGADGNQDAGTELEFVSPISGVDGTAVVGTDGLAGGVDLEAYDAWRDRILLRRARIPRGGAAGDWEGWALEVSGVTRAWEDPLGMGPGSVVIRIVADDSDSGPTPSQQLIDTTQAHINEKKNVQAKAYVDAPDTTTFAPEMSVTPDTADVRANVEASLQDFLEREAKPGGTLLISHIRAAIILASGVEDYTLQSPTSDVSYSTGVLPIWGGVTWL